MHRQLSVPIGRVPVTIGCITRWIAYVAEDGATAPREMIAAGPPAPSKVMGLYFQLPFGPLAARKAPSYINVMVGSSALTAIGDLTLSRAPRPKRCNTE